ncbi:MAG TPA: DUF134 domain-containing protein [Acidobacteriota bacterium]|nr:DUF134 domain-containing protein [Acidobacteriota bacterium]
MPRPRKRRFCRRYQADRVYKPQGIPLRQIDTVVLGLDQFEAMRLCDIEQLDQEAAGMRMGISRGTVQRLLYQGRKQLLEAILKNSAVIINLKESEDQHADMHSVRRRRGDGQHHS